MIENLELKELLHIIYTIMEDDQETKNPTTLQLVTFLKKIIKSLENNNLDNDQLLLVSEMYMKYKYLSNPCETPREDLLKYTSLGYHIYTNLLPSKPSQ